MAIRLSLSLGLRGLTSRKEQTCGCDRSALEEQGFFR
jgi:hypothetical protein